MKPITYKISGVDIDKANIFVKGIQGFVQRTLNAGVIKDPGAFGSLFALDKDAYQEPVLVSSTDGVGTKLLVAKAAKKHDTIGIDLVAMNVNDVLCVGAKPLFFLDYIACGKIDLKVLNAVVKGITEGCLQAGCSLIGGETAEMPGLYKKNDYDLAGFAVGIVERSKIINGAQIKPDDRVIGLASSGLHSNGYSLARKVLSLAEQKRFAAELLKPTKIYVREVLQTIEKFPVRGIAHLTGGAFYEKLTKILPACRQAGQPGMCFSIDRTSWPVPNIFQKIQKKGKIENPEMFRTFNMGIGMALVVAKEDAIKIRSFLAEKKIESYIIGKVINHPKHKVVFS